MSRLGRPLPAALRHTLLPVVLLALAGCGGEPEEDIHTWMQNVVTRKPPAVAPIPAGAPYNPSAYLGFNNPDPFNPSRMATESDAEVRIVAKLTGQPDQQAKADRNNILEVYPLSSFKMVGYLILNEKTMAAVAVEDILKQVKVGDYIGSDFGKVVRIEEHQITVVEKVRTAGEDGEWVDRTVKMPLATQKD